MPFTPSRIQNVMLSVYNQAKAYGLNITSTTLISTTVMWGATHNYWWSNPTSSDDYRPYGIGEITAAYNELVANGLLPDLS